MLYKLLIKNTFIFSIGNIISKLIIFLLLPFLTNYFSPEEFGTIDLFMIFLSLLAPILAFNSVEYLVREVSKSQTNEDGIKTTFSTVLGFTGICLVIFFTLTSLVAIYTQSSFLLLLTFAVTLQILVLTFKQFHRSMNFNKAYVGSEIIYSTIFSILVILFMILNLNLYYYFLAIILAFLVELFYLAVSNKVYKYFCLKSIEFNRVKNIISYSFPLMLNSIMLYVINLSNRYFIIFFVNIGAAGIFAANMRLPLIIYLLYNYLYKAVQILIFKYPKANFNKILNVVFGFLFVIIALLTIYNDFILAIFISEEYHTISSILPLMYLTALYSNYANLLGLNFELSYKTRHIFTSSVAAGLMSLLLNFALIPFFGILGAVISMLISFIVMIIVRLHSLKKKTIMLNHRKMIVSTCLIILLPFMLDELDMNKIILTLGSVLFIILIYGKEIRSIRKDEIA